LIRLHIYSDFTTSDSVKRKDKKGKN